MKRLLKIIALVTAFACVFALFSACSSGKEKNEPVTNAGMYYDRNGEESSSREEVKYYDKDGKFISYCRLVKCSHESAGKKEKGGHNKIGNVHLKWAFSEGAVLFLRNNERGQRWHDKLVQRYGKAKAMSIIAQQLGRTVYYMLKRKEAFNPDKFYGDKKIENKDSGGEHLA